MSVERFVELLAASGAVAPDAVGRATSGASATADPLRIASTLLEMRAATERALAEALAQVLGNPVAILSECVVDVAWVRALPADVLHGSGALPIAGDATSVTVAAPTSDPAAGLEPLAFALGRRVVPVVAIPVALTALLARVHAAAASGVAIVRGDNAAGDVAGVVCAVAPAPEEESSFNKRALGAIRLKQVAVRSGEGRTISAPGTLRAVDDAALSATTAPQVFVVDDDDDIRAMLVKALTHDGCEVHEARTGDQAANYLHGHRPDVILLDAMLPGVHGFELCAALKRAESHRHIPVIMISAVHRGWMQAREAQEVYGADAFVEKPFELQLVRRLVAQFTRRDLPRPEAPEAFARRIQDAKTAYRAHAEAQEWKDGLVAVDQWLALDPFDAEAWLVKGVLCTQLGEHVHALTALETAVVYDPSLVHGFLQLAVTYEKLGFLRRARATWVRAKPLATDAATIAAIDTHLQALAQFA